MKIPLSCRTLRALTFELPDSAVNAPVLLGQCGLNAAGPPQAVRHHRHMRSAEAKHSRDAALNVATKLGSIGRGVHISCEGNSVTRNVVPFVKDAYISVKSNVGILSRQERLALIASKISALRRERNLKQGPLAELCGVSRVQVSRWEHALDMPSANAMLKISGLVEDEERQWWRDQCSEQAGFDLQAIDSSGTYMATNLLRTIPLMKARKGVGALGLVASSDVERELHFPSEWFPEGGSIRAVRTETASGLKMIAMVDVSRRDADRLVGHMVAVQTPAGIEVRWLGKQDDSYMLLPFQPEQQIRLLRPHGEHSIVGLVRWIGDAIDGAQRKGRSH